MSSDKTLTCNGTYSTSTKDVQWTQPTLNSNGTLGGSSFAVKGDTDYNSTNRASFRAFNGNGTSDWWSATTKNNWPINMIMYFPTPVRIASLHIYNSGTPNYNTVTSFTEGTIDYSSDGSSWTTAKSFTNTYVGRGGNSGTSAHPEYQGDWYINSITSSSISSYYKQYWRIHATAGYLNSNVNQGLSEVYITAYTGTTSYTYYWDKSIT